MRTMLDVEQYITVSEAADLTHLRPLAIRNAIEAGKIKGGRFKGLIIVSRSSVLEYKPRPHKRLRPK